MEEKKRSIRVAQVQIPVYTETEVLRACLMERFDKAAQYGADLVMLPEMFCCPYDSAVFPQMAEPAGGRIWQLCSDLAAGYGVYLAAGSMPEIDETDGRVYNTAFVFDRKGNEIARHRKMHLFDIDVEGGQRFMESDSLSAGNEITVFDTEFGTMGICICYDIRFPEIVRLMALRGADIVLVPAAFNMTTGPMHWELSFRAQAVFNQVFMLATSAARDMESSYHAWGHTMAVDPWGNVLSELDEKEGILLSELDLDITGQVRQQLPFLKHRRTDVYRLSEI